MPTHDMIIANDTGAAVRADINLALAALVANSISATAPTTTYAGMFWADTTAMILKQRNTANSAWITIGALDAANLGLAVLGAAANFAAITAASLAMNSYSAGTWTTPAFAAGNFYGNGSMTWTVAAGDVTTFEYTIVNKMMTINFDIRTSTVGGTPSTALQILVPASKVASKTSIGSAKIIDAGGTSIISYSEIQAASSNLNIYASAANANWSASTDTTAVRGSITFEID